MPAGLILKAIPNFKLAGGGGVTLPAGAFGEDFMAIDKAVENEYGAEFTYHKLRDVRVVNDDRIGVQLTLTVQSWLNKQARIDGKEPTVRQCIISNADFAMTPFYALLKAKFPDFKAGKDDFNNDFKEPAGGAEDGEQKKAASTFSVQTAQGRLLSRYIEGGDVEGDNE